MSTRDPPHFSHQGNAGSEVGRCAFNYATTPPRESCGYGEVMDSSWTSSPRERDQGSARRKVATVLDRSALFTSPSMHAESTPMAKPRYSSSRTSHPAGFLGSKPLRRPDSLPTRGAPTSLTPAQPAPPSTTTEPAHVFPALHLRPVNFGTFIPKQISLNPPGTRIKIGRQTNAKTIPNGTNGYFDSKVLSRAHAEVWSEDGKVFIKDVKSSNGTFINGERLSPESSESDVFELNTDDVVEFGIDILTDDTKTIVHHKVSAKVHIVLNADDALASSREFDHWYRDQQAAQAQQQQLPRGGAGRAQRPGQGGGMGNGVGFEHMLSRVQGELQKARDTGANLADVNMTLTQVHDTLGGGAPPPIPPNAGIPGRSGPSAFPPRENASHAQSIAALQAQLADTQTSLAGHVGKIRDLEGLLAEHDVIKREVGSLRNQMEEAQASMSAMIRDRESVRSNGRESPIAALLEAREAEDDDDAASISSVDTISPSRSNGINGRSSREITPDADDIPEHDPSDAPSSPPSTSLPIIPAIPTSEADSTRETLLAEQNDKLVTRLEGLSAELEEATRLGAQLQEQHASASQTIKALEDRIAGLEKAVEEGVKEAEGRAEEKWVTWRETFESSWRTEREGWEVEREGLRKAVRDWEEGKERDKKEKEEREEQRSARRAARAARKEGASDELEDGSSGDETDEESEGDDITSTPATSGPTSPSKRSPTRAKGAAASARRRSTSPSSLASSSGVTPLPLKTLPSAVSAAAVEALGGGASDSDSTIREKSARAKEQAGSSPEGGLVSRDEQPGAGSQQGLPFSLAGAVVVLAVAVGYGAALKLKE
ncbi:hypothetical protein JCM11641_005019 [Rhodosporidiobolus odoratus]